jgi:hypothetical protein
VLPGPEYEPAQLTGAAQPVAHPVVGPVAQQVRGGHHPVAVHGDQRLPGDHPRVDDVLARFAFQLAQHGVGRHAHPGQDGLDVGVHQRRGLVTVAAAEGADLDRWHGGIPEQMGWRAATGAVPDKL